MKVSNAILEVFCTQKCIFHFRIVWSTWKQKFPQKCNFLLTLLENEIGVGIPGIFILNRKECKENNYSLPFSNWNVLSKFSGMPTLYWLYLPFNNNKRIARVSFNNLSDDKLLLSAFLYLRSFISDALYYWDKRMWSKLIYCSNINVLKMQL